MPVALDGVRIWVYDSAIYNIELSVDSDQYFQSYIYKVCYIQSYPFRCDLMSRIDCVVCAYVRPSVKEAERRGEGRVEG